METNPEFGNINSFLFLDKPTSIFLPLWRRIFLDLLDPPFLHLSWTEYSKVRSTLLNYILAIFEYGCSKISILHPIQCSGDNISRLTTHTGKRENTGGWALILYTTYFLPVGWKYFMKILRPIRITYTDPPAPIFQQFFIILNQNNSSLNHNK